MAGPSGLASKTATTSVVRRESSGYYSDKERAKHQKQAAANQEDLTYIKEESHYVQQVQLRSKNARPLIRKPRPETFTSHAAAAGPASPRYVKQVSTESSKKFSLLSKLCFIQK